MPVTTEIHHQFTLKHPLRRGPDLVLSFFKESDFDAWLPYLFKMERELINEEAKRMHSENGTGNAQA